MSNRRFHSTGKGSPHPYRQCKVTPQGFPEKSSSPEAPVFPRKTLHSRGADLWEPVE
ncbi:MAG: hypothetical protein ACLRPS_12145 [Paraprevotella clara]|uniref:Uncharacterized protein n=1 Tax=Paraprevotella clara TaxID=454154 RepID=A0A6N2YRH0_9BACT